MVFDPETKDGYRIYWPKKGSISVERSVKFNFNDETIVRVLPLEGESEDDELKTQTPTQNPEDTSQESVAEPVKRRGSRIRKESKYVRMLKEGSAITGSKGVLPKGMRGVDENAEAEHAMASVVEMTEGLMPTYEEAQKRPDWPKWEDAINKELDSLKKSGTWELVS